ncbi:cytochrome c oxidase subunit I [Paracoccus sp. YIM 132242]|uniref:cytochrome-c oxidase n=1 Tax=Paracoccus lichenicola TaxID=2665644 RepID=A0A6L6HPV4_9RHOB|nr:cytochrome c oxidase subunit I [Paracoccus lichenicola]MTE01197.1 cytochrome c oxidase subunit I [Paracoccus lichenicola]
MTALRLHKALYPIWRNDPGWKGVLTTVNNNTIGTMFILGAAGMFLAGGILAMLIRAQLASPRSAFMGPEVYNQIFTMHGTIMMFLFAIPFFEALTVFLLPAMLGTRDLAFPRLGAYGFWCYMIGATIMIVALLAGVAPDGGWFMYPPLSSSAHSPGINTDIWLLGISFIEISAIGAAVEVVVTVLRYRAVGMTLDRLPIFAWYMLVVAVMILTAFPPMILGSLILELERAFDMPFFQAEHGGDSLLWQHLFWLFGHPEVYIIFLPAAGVISAILPVMARTTLLGYGWVVAAAISLAVLSFGLWVHHMFTTGIPHMGLAFFSAVSTLVAVPTGVQIFAWIGTLWKGRPRMHLPMLWIMGFFVTFVMGGLTGVMVAMVPFDWQAHDTYFVVAHLHYVLIGGYVFPMIAGIYYWLPVLTGRKRFFRMGEVAFWLVMAGFHGTFLLLHWAGLLGMRRRVDSIEAGSGWEGINLLASVSGFVLAIGFGLVVLDVAANALVAVRGRRNPWNAGTLEWATPIPSPAYNVASIPVVDSRYPLHDNPGLPVQIARGEGFLGHPTRNRRETLAVSVSGARPDFIAVMPRNSIVPFAMAVVTSVMFMAPVWKGWWLMFASAGGVAMLAMVWAWAGGSRHDEGLLDAGRGVTLPPHTEISHPPGWWGSLFLLLADAVLFGSLLFGYAFLWTVAPNWPPPAILEPGTGGPALAAGGAVLACGGIRGADQAIRRGRAPWPGLVASLAGLAALGGAAWTVFGGTTHDAHAYDATLWVIAGYAVFHAGVAGLMALFLMARIRAGFISARRCGDARVVRLWIDYAALTAALGLGAAWLPGWLA